MGTTEPQTPGRPERASIGSVRPVFTFPNIERLPSDERVVPVAWYAVAWSRELRAKPEKRRLAGRDIVLFRDAKGRARCVEAYCAHRGADLALGSCADGRLVCAYHGWAYGGDGVCTHIPAHPDRPVPAFARVRAYPVEEKAGLVWVYPQSASGDAPPSLNLFAELSDPAFALSPYRQEWRAHLTRVVESVLDVAHLAFVHKKTIGRRVPEEVKKMEFRVPDRDSITIENGGGLLEYRFPQQWILKPARPGRSQFINYVTFTPVDREKTVIFGYAGRTFARGIPGMHAIFSRYSLKILNEDKTVVESQHPRPIPEALRMEAHVPADAPQVRFRNRWFEFLAGDEAKVVLAPDAPERMPPGQSSSRQK
jgi:phenylpropionate dioxygenase-like ring-hydroxylating dioxygenase large terminal subunit